GACRQNQGVRTGARVGDGPVWRLGRKAEGAGDRARRERTTNKVADRPDSEIQSAAQAYRTQTQRHINELNEKLERERTERAANREMMARSSAPPQREITAERAQQGGVATDSPSEPTAPGA